MSEYTALISLARAAWLTRLDRNGLHCLLVFQDDELCAE